MTFAHVYNKIQNEDKTRKHTLLLNTAAEATLLLQTQLV